MYAKNRILKLGICILIMAALAGCATSASPPLSSQTDIGIARPSWLDSSWKIAYSPQIPPGKSVDDALADIEKYLNTDASDIEVAYDVRDPDTWYHIQRCTVNADMITIQGEKSLFFGKTENTENENRSINFDLSFSDLSKYTMYVIQTSGNTWDYGICLRGLVNFYFKHPANVKQIADAIFIIQKHGKEQHEQNFELFKSQAAQYRALAIKPAMSEEQRKFVVQANSLNRLKDYPGAVKMYQKAIDLDPVSYPEAYFNLALINAQLKRYDTAISYMKQYLMLVPDANDARSAQDKIYEWEIIEKN